MRTRTTLLLVFLLALMSCKGTEFVYFMESQLHKSKEFSLNNQHLILNVPISLQDSDDMAVYAFQIEELVSHKITLHIVKDNQVQLANSKLRINGKEINLPILNSNTDFVIDDRLFLEAVSNIILNNEIANIQLVTDAFNVTEANPMKVEMTLNVKGTFIGGH